MQAEYARGLSAPEAFEDPESLALRPAPTCATFAPEEPPHAEASRVSPTTPTIASASANRLVIHALFVAIMTSAPSSSVVWALTRLY
jgi:hypothetical protein